ncbi:MAG: MlaC/ttg2D family ABC transporter substrate-binding protein [Desulforhopalus sp.]
MRKIIFTLCLLSLVVAFNGVAAEKSPTEYLQPVLDDLIIVLSDESLKGFEHLEERRSKIMDLISGGFDFREMSRRVLGKTWREIDDAEKDHFTAIMTKLLENVYIGKLEGYSGQSVDFAGEVIKGKKAQVTTLLENEGVKIPVHYIMRDNGTRWMVYDINIEGVSLVRNYQEQFKSILRKEKYHGLVKVLEEKNRSFLEEENTRSPGDDPISAREHDVK